MGVIKDIKADMTNKQIDGLVNGASPCYSMVDSTLEQFWGQPENPIEQIARNNRLSVS